MLLRSHDVSKSDGMVRFCSVFEAPIRTVQMKEGIEPLLPPLFPPLYFGQTRITTNNSRQILNEKPIVAMGSEVYESTSANRAKH